MATPRFAIATACAGCILFACTTVTSMASIDLELDSGIDAASSSSSGTTAVPDASKDVVTADAGIDVEVSAPSSSGSSGTSGNPASSSSSSSGASVVDAGAPTFTDDFDRVNSGAIGDGWLAKTADHFAIDGNQLLQVGTAEDGYDNIELFRPETALDVQIDVDITYPATDLDATVDPTLSARMSDASISQIDVFDGYAFYLTRESGGISREETGTTAETELDTRTLTTALETDVAYHVTFTVSGTAPVSLGAVVTRIEDGMVMETFRATDATTTRYATAGHTGIGGGNGAAGLRWDNYARAAPTVAE